MITPSRSSSPQTLTIAQDLLMNVIYSVGVCWGIVEPVSTIFKIDLTTFRVHFLIMALILAISKTSYNWMKKKWTYKVPNRDATLEFEIGDLLKYRDYDILVPINNKFIVDNNNGIHNSISTLSQLVKKQYDGDPSKLQIQINEILKNKAYVNLSSAAGEYKYGTVVQLKNNGFTFILVAATALDQNGRSYADKTILNETLSAMWDQISAIGHSKNLVMPVLGTGSARSKLTRSEVIKEITKSYISSCANKVIIKQLCICVRANDNIDHIKINNWISAYIVCTEVPH